ncbi:MAG: cytochrome C [Acidiferrobacteraceae bacterium]|nr:cytochrome C [Acidiferrobacteraceae bacterium]|tara:strand:+ start:43837 stop:44340 length:504 start_codon:yes stop_codon:yes gene_type:complete
MKSFLTICSLLFVLVIVVFVDWHLDTPNRVEQQRSSLLGGGSGVGDRVSMVGQINVEKTEEELLKSEESPKVEIAESLVSDDTLPDGEQVYSMACMACHGAGIAGAPRTGDIPAWEERMIAGMDTLINHAINGFQGEKGVMPAKGGNPSLSDGEVAAAVEYMVAQSQ